MYTNQHTERQLLEKYINNECNREEFDRAYAMITSPTAAIDYDTVLREQWNKCMQSEKPTLDSPVKAKKVRMSTPKRKNLIRLVKYAAAVVILVTGILLIQHYIQASQELIFNQHHIAELQHKQIQLNDGSTVNLGAGSRLGISEAYDNERDVSIEGEATFDVLHTQNKSFQVHTPHLVVNVVGTSFNVRNFEDEPTLMVSVKSGIVETHISLPEHQQMHTLTKNMQLTYNKVSHKVEIVKLDVASHLRQSKQQLYFDETPLYQVVTDLERYHGVEIEIADPSIARMVISGAHENSTAEAILESICFINHLKYEKKKEGHYILRQP